ncbi:Holliday junction DNA helicase RuvA [Candidatus Kaiserbacteria bacterium RIFCSPLOWO2_01_FULL_54_13]|uniref:Holliday junction branch migration complex subunit RuvA n=1 Tax=Candidatus Kaiserbacteria bacterium RIFCSPLOWO2_01_FULL_54_13 TaxID=1798512 RepID=A0A1F6F1K5_9BACT|nr:MAG: Holliday junction DNA helicase RuvA [Candidatus Kaiserbacteria bacterium RIFCSPLOWO2_01_FULL_54_13]
MIGRIEGVVSAKRAGFAVISAGGVGYKVAAMRETLGKLKEKQAASLWTHLAVREDALDLYGFTNEEDLHFFELLLTVHGIGPKSALAILDIADAATLRSAISAGNSSYLTKVSGIGKKTAEKIVVELRDKVGKSAKGSERSLSGDEEALEAMRTLGYTHSEAREALRKVPTAIESGSARLREALRLLGSR